MALTLCIFAMAVVVLGLVAVLVLTATHVLEQEE